MVTFSTRDNHSELNKKFKIKGTDDRITVISGDEYDKNKDIQQAYICDTCGTTLEYNKIDDALWCNTCVRWFQRKDAKKTVPFEIPQPQNLDTVLVSCGETPGLDDVRLDHQPDLKGGFLALSKKGSIRFTSYNESVG